MSALPCRIVRHDRSDGSHHLDIFIRDPEREMLPTYEVSQEAVDLFFLALKRERNVRFVLRSEGRGADGVPEETAIPLGIKNEHRRTYWDFNGELTGGRGRIGEICRGKMEFRGNMVHFIPETRGICRILIKKILRFRIFGK